MDQQKRAGAVERWWLVARRFAVAWLRLALARHKSLALTTEGLCLVGAMMLIGLAALNTAAPLLYLMFAMLCAFFVMSAVMATNTIRWVELERDVPHVWVAGRPMVGRVRARNAKRLTASYSLRVRDMAEDNLVLGATFFGRIAPGQTDAEEYHCVFLKRGVYRLERLELATRFPFGLIERRLHYPMAMEVLVLPQTIPMARAMFAARSDLGDFDANVRGRGAGLYGLRVYTPELPARDIHWKVSARRGTLIAREYESEEKRRASVVLDNSLPRGTAPDAVPGDLARAFEQAVIVAASAVEWLCLHGHEVELRTASGVVGVGQGGAHSTRCRRALARLALVPPPAVDTHLYNPEPDIVHFPVIFQRSSWQAREGVVLLSVEDFAEDLDRAMSQADEGGAPANPAPQVF